MKIRNPEALREATFDLTPLIDVVLLLIIFFMFTSHFARTQLSAMDLPREKGEASQSRPDEASFIIEMDKAGQMKVLGQAVTLARIEELLQADLAREKLRMSVVVRADRQAASAHLNRLALALMKLGVRDWKLATAGPEAAGGS